MIVYYAVEDELSKAVIERLIHEILPRNIDKVELGARQGCSEKLQKNLKKYINLSNSGKVIMLTDLDNVECPPSLRKNWLDAARVKTQIPSEFKFCIAVREVEAWLVADKSNFAAHFCIPNNKIPQNFENTVQDPKKLLLNLLSKSKDKEARQTMARVEKSNLWVGLEYNSRLRNFALNYWDPQCAKRNNLSLARAIRKIAE